LLQLRATSTIVGYERCGRFGSWGFGARLSFDVGATSLRLDGRAIDAREWVGRTATQYRYAAAPGDDRPVRAAGARMRWSLGGGRTFYMASQLDIMSITGGPELVADVSAHGETTTMIAGASGNVAQNVVLVGVHRRLGPVSIAAEFGPGVRLAWFTPRDLLSGAPVASQDWLVLYAQPAAEVWLSPHITVGVQAGVDLLDHANMSAGLVLGLHVTPYDMARTL
jgi:hypothetical protein